MNHTIYAVGGSIRDEMMHIMSNDFDFCFVINQNQAMSVEEGFAYMRQWLKDEGFKVFLETPAMLTIRAKFPDSWTNNEQSYFYNGKTADFVLARKELAYDAHSRHPVVSIGTLEDDLLRRDFTINAMARDLDGNLIDPFNGVEDLRRGLLRTPRAAAITMADDPLRIMRAIRFAVTHQLTIHKGIIAAIHNTEIQKKLFEVVSINRIREELTKMFKCSTSRSLSVLNKIDQQVPGFSSQLFEKTGIWLKPTTESK